MKTFDEVPVEKEKVMHEVREVTASFPSRFTDHSSPAPEMLIRAFGICLVGENFKSELALASHTQGCVTTKRELHFS